MKQYILSAALNKLVTTQVILARDDFSAKVLSVQKININYASDKRYAKGEIILKDPDNKVVWLLSAEIGKEEKKGGEK